VGDWRIYIDSGVLGGSPCTACCGSHLHCAEVAARGLTHLGQLSHHTLKADPPSEQQGHSKEANSGHVEAIKALVQLGAQLDAQTATGHTPLQLSVQVGQHQAADVLRELERTARARKAAATSGRAQPGSCMSKTPRRRERRRSA
jgi:hypothetical protein